MFLHKPNFQINYLKSDIKLFNIGKIPNMYLVLFSIILSKYFTKDIAIILTLCNILLGMVVIKIPECNCRMKFNLSTYYAQI